MTPIPTVIDLYHGDIVESFEELRAAGIERVIHKATEGVTEVDPAYASRMPEALAAGLQWEAYHFWRPDDPDAQAISFLDAAKGASALWLDYEVSGGTPGTIIALMQHLYAATGKKPGLYTTRSLAEHLASRAVFGQASFLSDCPLWIAEPGVTRPIWPTYVWSELSLWQYTWNGKIAGVKGKCDLNCVRA